MAARRLQVPLLKNPRMGVYIDPDATEGAQIGVNLLDASGNVLDVTGLAGLLAPYFNGTSASTGVSTGSSAGGGSGSNSGYPANQSPAAAPTNYDLDISMIAGLGKLAYPTINYILVGDGVNWVAKPMSGDATIVASGAVTVTHINGALLGSTTATPGNILVASLTNAWTSVVPTGDVTVTTTGIFTIPNDTVTNAKLANMAAHTIKANNTGSTGDPLDVTLSALLDSELGSTRGAIIYRGASGWAILGPGTSTYVLTSNGAGADPSYQPAGGGSVPDAFYAMEHKLCGGI